MEGRQIEILDQLQKMALDERLQAIELLLQLNNVKGMGCKGEADKPDAPHNGDGITHAQPHINYKSSRKISKRMNHYKLFKKQTKALHKVR